MDGPFFRGKMKPMNYKRLCIILLLVVIVQSAFQMKDLFKPKESKEVSFEEEISSLFDEAIENKTIEVYYQPIISCEDESVFGAEALSRWSVNGEYLSPSVFVQILEESGQVKVLDRYVFENVCAFQRKRIDEGKDAFSISVNLSALSAMDEDIAEDLRMICDEMKVSPSLINLEVTETLDNDPEALAETVERLKAAGFKTEIDDFGAGYASYYELSSIEYDILKIDKSIIDAISEQRGELLIKELLSLSKQLNMKVIAEGVETKDQIEFLKENGCDAIQGYYYSKPLPENEFIEYLSKH